MLCSCVHERVCVCMSRYTTNANFNNILAGPSFMHLCALALNKCNIFLPFVCCGGVFFFSSMTHPLLLAEHHWHNSLGRQTNRLTDRAEALKNEHWERDSQGQRTVVWYGLNSGLLKLCSRQNKKFAASDAKQEKMCILNIVHVMFYTTCRQRCIHKTVR